jgi:hypothetical protein
MMLTPPQIAGPDSRTGNYLVFRRQWLDLNNRWYYRSSAEREPELEPDHA